MRNKSIDYMKGLLVLGMILAHVVQFFYRGDGYKYPFSSFINQVTFSGFIFCFGYAFYVAYLRKDFKTSFWRLVIAILKCLIAFYISGYAYRILVEHRGFSKERIWNILILKDMPGWSEFLAAFAVISFVGLVFYVPLKKLINYPKIYWCVTGLLLLTTYLPYDKIKINQLGLFIGTTNFSCFPALQYFPYFMIGIYFAKKEIKLQPKYFFGSLLITVSAFFYIMWKGMPERFPPTFMWVVLPAFYLQLYYVAGQLFSRFEQKLGLMKVIAQIGSKSLFYLVISNIIIFAFSGANMGRFNIVGCIAIAIIIIALIYFLEGIAKDRTKKAVLRNDLA